MPCVKSYQPKPLNGRLPQPPARSALTSPLIMPAQASTYMSTNTQQAATIQREILCLDATFCRALRSRRSAPTLSIAPLPPICYAASMAESERRVKREIGRTRSGPHQRHQVEGDAMSTSSAGAGNLWPAEVIHVNEDGWVLVNRGRAHGVVPGLRLLVVGTGIRALRIRRTYEELDVLYVEETCAVAVATRAPAARRPKFYRGPDGELLVWVPLPEGWTYPHPGTDDTPADDTDDSDDDQDADEQEDQDD